MKKLLYILLGLVVLYLILALVGPKHVAVSRSISIAQSPDVVRSIITDYHAFHDQWSPWTEKDPAMQVTYTGEPGQVGHHYTWNGNKDVRSGAMTIASFSGDTIYEDLDFGDGNPAGLNFVVHPRGDSTDVTWTVGFDVSFGRRPFMLFLPMDKWMGADFERGLNRLKQAAESRQMQSAGMQVEEVDWKEVVYAGKRASMKVNEMSAFFGSTLGALMSDPVVKPMSAPTAIYFSMDPQNMTADFALCVAVAENTKIKNWESWQLPAGKALKVAYYGPYQGIGSAHAVIEKYLAEHQLTKTYVLEEYVSDPMKEKDSTKWLSNVYYLLK